MKTLFVGGPKDGKREFFPRNYGGTIRVAVFPQGQPIYDINTNDRVFDFPIHTYTLKQFRDEHGNDYEVAFHSSIKNPMEALIKGYRYHRNPRYGRSRRISKNP